MVTGLSVQRERERCRGQEAEQVLDSCMATILAGTIRAKGVTESSPSALSCANQLSSCQLLSIFHSPSPCANWAVSFCFAI